MAVVTRVVTIILFVFSTGAFADFQANWEFQLSSFWYPKGETSLFASKRLSTKLYYAPGEINWRTNKHIECEIFLQFDSEGFAEGVRTPSKRFRTTLGWDECYGEYRVDQWTISLGWKKVEWGTVVNSLADLCVYDFTRIPARECRSSPILDIQYGTTSFVEIFLKPIFTPSLLPRGKWRNIPPGVVLLESRDEENQLQAGLRVGTVLGITKLQLLFYHGYANNPYGEVAGLTPTGQVVIEPRYSEETLISASVVRDIPFWDLHGKAEVSYLEQKEGDDFIQYAFGLERLYSQLFSLRDRLLLALQYTSEEVIEEDDSIIQFRSNIRRAFEDAVLGIVTYRPNSHWNFSLRSTYNLSEEDYFFEPAVEWTPSGGHLKIAVGYQSVGGPRNTFWGQYRENDSLFFRFTWRF